MIWYCCCCCCMDIIKCEYKAITIKWNRCKFNLSNVSIWINIYTENKMVIRSQPQEEAAFLAWATHWNSKIETRSCTPQERGLSAFLASPFFLSLSCVLKFRALGVSFAGYPLPIGNSPSGITQFCAMSKQKLPPKTFFKCFPAVIPLHDTSPYPASASAQTNWIFKYERHF